MKTTVYDEISLTGSGNAYSEGASSSEAKTEHHFDTTSSIETESFRGRMIQVSLAGAQSVQISIDPVREEERSLVRRANRRG